MVMSCIKVLCDSATPRAPRPTGLGLLPESHDDRVVTVEDQVEAVRVMHDPGDSMGRRNRAEAARQVFLAHDIGGSGRRLALFGKFLAQAILAIVRLDLRLRDARQ